MDVINKFYKLKSINSDGDIRLIFVSTDWNLKNGDMVIDICQLLISAGIRLRLSMIGDAPGYARQLEFVDDKGFRRKSDPGQLVQLCEAYQNAHFLISPTKADAYGVVFSEAQAFGVPPISYDVGGTGSAILHGETGCCCLMVRRPVTLLMRLCRM